MNNVSIFLFAFSLFFLISCSDDDTESIAQEEPVQNFYALAVGNTWEYEVEERLSQEEEFQTLDLILQSTIEDTIIVNGKTYYTIVTTGVGSDSCSICENAIGNLSIRDSLGYLVDTKGQIKFSSENTDEYIFIDEEWAIVYGILSEDVEIIETELGELSTLVNNRYGFYTSGEEIPASDQLNYVSDIGMVFQTISFVSDDMPKWKIKLKNVSF